MRKNVCGVFFAILLLTCFASAKEQNGLIVLEKPSPSPVAEFEEENGVTGWLFAINAPTWIGLIIFVSLIGLAAYSLLKKK